MATALSISIAVAPNALADNNTDNIFSMEICKDPFASKFKLHLYYNSGQGGAYRNIGYSVYDFSAVKIGGSDPTVHVMKFCQLGVSNPWPGSGQRLKNNAASGENEHYKYMARVYFNSGYKGAQDVMGPQQHIDQFRHVKNENASFRWTS
ncbi:hypothetical protein B7755_048580 [Streptomyces sp. NBS 14/10]|uniref:hypothetical protein n=1 Tax=Streptomyces sp. NBS 14/10 TaxID=1945643 RepID=UPI000B7DA812|nr:hypothetical protein [Streptomyces sp. NBS 14/10]KAK1185259.1 hypothetical protein B7755_048580 [Streptomyces sp. NBS 14/10]